MHFHEFWPVSYRLVLFTIDNGISEIYDQTAASSHGEGPTARSTAGISENYNQTAASSHGQGPTARSTASHMHFGMGSRSPKFFLLHNLGAWPPSKYPKGPWPPCPQFLRLWFSMSHCKKALRYSLASCQDSRMALMPAKFLSNNLLWFFRSITHQNACIVPLTSMSSPTCTCVWTLVGFLQIDVNIGSD